MGRLKINKAPGSGLRFCDIHFLRPSEAAKLQYRTLRRRWFEVQIRSILDHAWSEIEHEVIYKSGVKYPVAIKRRFTAVAGALEVLEHAFAGLAIERNSLIEQYKTEYAVGLSDQESFDVARLLAFWKLNFPRVRAGGARRKRVSPFPGASLLRLLRRWR